MPRKIKYNLKSKNMELTVLNALQVDIPFSKSLNQLILKAYNRIFFKDMPYINVTFVPLDAYETFEDMKRDIENNNRLYVSTLHCEKTIFGNAQVNQMFRAIHDILHYIHNLDFSHGNECMVNYHQNIAFKNMGARQYDLDLLNIETVGQIVYHYQHGFFPDDQRTFTFFELKNLGY